MRFLIAAALMLVVAGCANLEGIYALKGKKAADAIAYLGLPSNEVNVAGKKILVWDRRGDVTASSFTTSGQTFVSADVLYCRIKLGLGSDETVEVVEIERNSAAYCFKK